MATPLALRFRARGTALVPNYDLEEARIRSFVGRKLVAIPDTAGAFGFAPIAEDTVVSCRTEYVKHCADGDLYAADEPTAALCNAYALAHGLPEVKFDPTFGGSLKPAFRAEKG